VSGSPHDQKRQPPGPALDKKGNSLAVSKARFAIVRHYKCLKTLPCETLDRLLVREDAQ
jgi:hypothetical protein